MKSFSKRYAEKKVQGFTMMELVIILGLFGIVSYVLFNALADADNAQHRLDMQLRMRHVLDKTIAEVSEGSGYFVPMASNSAVYYACYDRQGKRQESQMGSIEYGITNLKNVKIPGKECLGGKFVTYIKPISTKYMAEIYVYMINEKTAKKQAGYKKPIMVVLNKGF